MSGSKGYDNYRHQADVCHAFHTLKNHGIPESQIVVMMYDDIANNPENPFKGDSLGSNGDYLMSLNRIGNIINKPGGRNLYPGVPKDYVGRDVNPDNFFKVLNGDKTLKSRGKKVIESNSNDNVFIYFADHGAQGLSELI